MKKSELKQIVKEEVINAFKSSPLLRESWHLTEANNPITQSKASNRWKIEPEAGKFRAISPAGTKSKDLFNTKEEAQNHIDSVVEQYGPQNESQISDLLGKTWSPEPGVLCKVEAGFGDQVLVRYFKGTESKKNIIKNVKMSADRCRELLGLKEDSEHKWPQDNCSQCKKQVDEIDLFPGGICVDCYEKKMKNVPTHMLGKPDFVGTLRKEGKAADEAAYKKAVEYAKSLSAVADRRGTWASHRDAQEAWEHTGEIDTDKTHSPEGLRRCDQYNKYCEHHSAKMQQAPDHPAKLKRMKTESYNSNSPEFLKFTSSAEAKMFKDKISKMSPMDLQKLVRKLQSEKPSHYQDLVMMIDQETGYRIYPGRNGATRGK